MIKMAFRKKPKAKTKPKAKKQPKKKEIIQRWVAVSKVSVRESQGWKEIKKNDLGDLVLMEKQV